MSLKQSLTAGTMTAPQPLAAIARQLEAEVQGVVLGQQEVIHQVLLALLAGGHVLIEGLPGLGKTLLVRALAKAFSGQSARVQFTPDLMPNDIVGHVMYDVKNGSFSTRKGPVFTNLLIADEINRAPAKTQSAMLEVMQEGQVSLDGATMSVPSPFMTLATQNPFEHEGTYPLPDAQLDRFILKIHMGYPTTDAEISIVEAVTGQSVGSSLDVSAVRSVATPVDILQIQQTVAHVRSDRAVVEFAVALTAATRAWPGISRGAGPRGSLSLVRLSKAQAFLEGRDFITPDDVRTVAIPCLRHRVSLAPELDIEGQTADRILPRIIDSVAAPRK